MDEDPECQVVIATVAFANGLNVKALLDSISLGIPDTVDQLRQQEGCVGRTRTVPRGEWCCFSRLSLLPPRNKLQVSYNPKFSQNIINSYP